MHFVTPQILLNYASALERYYETAFPPLAPLAKNAFLSTVETTVQKLEDGRYFVITGDIPAMWLRDSAAQLVNYIPFARDSEEVRQMLEGAIETQAYNVCIDPYANAFNAEPNGHGFRDLTQLNPSVWERKFEVDSLCAPIYLVWQYWKETGHTTAFSPRVHEMLRRIVGVFRQEQDHGTSPYSFQRLDCPETDTLTNEGRGTPVGYTGLVWSGFRPSDDRCELGYLIPSNMMAQVAMSRAAEIASEIYHDTALEKACLSLADDICQGIQQYAIYDHPKQGRIYAYETDGLGKYNLMDDANSPSLLSMPYLGFCRKEDPLYLATRKFILSEENPYFYQGTFARGIGSPHTPAGSIWHISLIMQALTATDREEILRCLNWIASTHANCCQMHESFDANDPDRFTRSWFAWANTLLAQLMIQLMDADFFHLS